MSSIITRRDFLKRTCQAGLLTATGSIIQAATHELITPEDDLDRYDFIFARVRFEDHSGSGHVMTPDLWNVRPGGDANLLEELSSVLRCRVKPIYDTQEWEPQYASDGQLNAVVSFEDFESVKPYPFLFMTGENYFTFSSQAKANVKAYLERGGFLFMDECVAGDGTDFFYQSAYAMLEETFGPGSVQRIPLNHEVFNNVYDFSHRGLPAFQYMPIRRLRLPYILGKNHGARGIFIGDRLAVFLSSTDLHCGWCDRSGFFFGQDNYRKAIKMGINVITYAMMY